MNDLSEQERVILRTQHKKERDGRVRDRIKAVLLQDKGWPIKAIAEALLLSQDAIHNHLVDYKNTQKLKPENGGSSEKLSLRMNNWLQRHGFSYKKPAIVPSKANKEQQKQWLIEYEKLKQNLPENETICFIDGVHPQGNCMKK